MEKGIKIVKEIILWVLALLLIIASNKLIYNLLSNSWIFNLNNYEKIVYTTIFVLLLILCYLPFFLRETKCKWYRFKHIAFAITIYLVYVLCHDFPRLEYDIIIGSTLIFLEFSTKLKGYRNRNKEKSSNNQLIIEKPENIYKKNSEGVFCFDTYNRVELLEATTEYTIDFVDDIHSTVIAITGTWGSGKTSFKEGVKNYIKKQNRNYKIIDFNVWSCDSPEAIIKSFFRNYSTQMGAVVPELNPIIRSYAKDLLDIVGNTSLEMKHTNNIIQKFLFDDTDKISKIKDILKKEKIRTFIFIDDIDRMNCEEIIEILKLVRNNADFPYTQFILLYDKEYIAQTIKDKITNPDLYLEKIVNITIPLSKIDQLIIADKLWNYIKEDIEEYEKTLTIDKALSFESTEEYRSNINTLLTKYLANERETIRLCNQFRIILNYYKHKKVEIFYCDLLWILLLENKFAQIYKFIYDNPNCLSNLTNSELAFDTSEIKNGEEYISLETYIEEKFPKNNDIYKYPRKHIENYENRFRYFMFGYSSYEYQTDDIINALKNKQWPFSHKSKYSLVEKLRLAIEKMINECSSIEFDNIKSYIQGLLDEKGELFPDKYSKKDFRYAFHKIFIDDRMYITTLSNEEKLNRLLELIGIDLNNMENKGFLISNLTNKYNAWANEKPEKREKEKIKKTIMDFIESNIQIIPQDTFWTLDEYYYKYGIKREEINALYNNLNYDRKKQKS